MNGVRRETRNGEEYKCIMGMSSGVRRDGEEEEGRR